MVNRKSFAQKLAEEELSHVDRAVAFLWFYRYSQNYDERSASELAEDLREEGFPKPNVFRLKTDLKKSKYTIKGKRPNTFQLDLRKIKELDQTYLKLLKIKVHVSQEHIIPSDIINNTRKYLEQMVNQINSCYDLNFFDSCAVMMRRLMESLIIEIYISQKRQQEIQKDGAFLMLDKLIGFICADRNITLSRNTPRTMRDVKQIGDTAAHDRVYITQQQDINDLKSGYRKLIQELLVLSKISK